MRRISLFTALAVAALAAASPAAGGKPDIVKFPPMELVGIPQHDCGDYELMLSGTMLRHARFTLDEAGNDVAEHRQVRITGTIWNSIEPSKSAPYFRSISIDSDYVTGERAITGTTHVVLAGQGNILHSAGIRVEDWTDVDFETVFPTLLFQGGPFDTLAPGGWDQLCAALR